MKHKAGGYLCCMQILMVCLGNICRSPLAQGILEDKASKAGLSWNIDSCGTSSYHEGEPPHILSRKVAKLNGIDISKQMCRQFIEQDMLHFDKIYAMDKEVYAEMKRISGKLWDPSKTDLLMNEVHPGKNVDIPDPWYGTEDGYHLVFQMIAEACESLIQKAKVKKQKTA